jgi:alpha-methylacyl-CoA racemase
MPTDESVKKPLHNLRVIEFEGIGPGPLAGRMLSDLGAHVIVVARPTPSTTDRTLIGENTENPLRRGKEIIVLDLLTHSRHWPPEFAVTQQHRRRPRM